MFHILGFLLLIFVVILVVGLTIVGSVLRTIFGFGRRRPASSQSTHTYRTESRQTSESNNEEVGKEQGETKHKKIFTKDEGEYIDFEEVK